jgi:hypothetical protein
LRRLNPNNKYDPLIYELKEHIKTIDPRNCVKEAKQSVKDRVAVLKEEKKHAQEKCKELPVKERKPCKDRAVAAFDASNAVLQNELASHMVECDKLKLQKTESKDKIKEYQELKKRGKQELKAYKERTKVFKAELKEKSRLSKSTALKIKAELQRIRSIQDVPTRKATMKEFRNHGELVRTSKVLKQEVKDLRAEISKINVQIKNKKITESNMKLKKISQQYALNKYCNI